MSSWLETTSCSGSHRHCGILPMAWPLKDTIKIDRESRGCLPLSDAATSVTDPIV